MPHNLSVPTSLAARHSAHVACHRQAISANRPFIICPSCVQCTWTLGHVAWLYARGPLGMLACLVDLCACSYMRASCVHTNAHMPRHTGAFTKFEPIPINFIVHFLSFSIKIIYNHHKDIMHINFIPHLHLNWNNHQTKTTHSKNHMQTQFNPFLWFNLIERSNWSMQKNTRSLSSSFKKYKRWFKEETLVQQRVAKCS